MMLESYISLILLTLVLAGAFVVHMDAKYQRERRRQRIMERFGNEDV